MKQIFIIYTLLFFFLTSLSQGQTTTGMLGASSIVSNSLIGSVAWSNPLQALLNDANKTSSTALLLGDDTEYLMATGFNFNIPVGMVINGIQVEIIKNASNGLSYNVTDNEVKIVKGGIVTGSNLALPGKWSGSDQTSSYGSSTNTWGTTWTPADINDANFGVVISAHLAGLLLPTARVNSISISVTYDNAPLPVSLVSFDVEKINQQVNLSWSTATESNNRGFTIQRSSNGTDWKSIQEVLSHPINSTTLNIYSYTDQLPLMGTNYYRLLQTDIDQSITYSAIQVIDMKREEQLSLYPNPANDNMHLMLYASSDEMQEVSVLLSDLTGRTVQVYKFNMQERALVIPVSHLPAGDYLLSLTLNDEVVYKRILVGH